MNKPAQPDKLIRKLRCAVYTRKSSEEGLEQEFNSLHAQREACEAYIASQRSEGWVLVRDQYDDGSISGGTLERPGLKRLLADIENGLVDVVVVYKIDRLSRALMDFSKLVEVFDRNGVTFVSVTQSFNTTTSMGRLTLNILLSFAQFEREVTAERIRDKVKASRMKGIWMGGSTPLGYDVKDRKLIENLDNAATVRWVFARFIEIGSGTELARELDQRGVTTSRGHRIDKKFIYQMLNNRVYIGETVHKGYGLSRRAPSHHHPRVVGQGSYHPDRKPAQTRQQHPQPDARAAERAAVRSRWRGILPDAHLQGRQAIPLLCQPERSEAWCRIVPDWPDSSGGDRGRRHWSIARGVSAAGDYCRHLESGQGRRGRHHRNRGPRCADAV